MCGLLGVITKTINGLNATQLDWFQDALVVGALRGIDGTGVMHINPHKDYEVLKVASYPYPLLFSAEWPKIRTRAFSSKLIAGHNRKATTGSQQSLECTHPFESKNNKIILMHNGYVEGWHTIMPEAPVDSVVASEIISTSETVEKAVAQLKGAFALVWYNFEEHSINFLRNSARPLFIAEDKESVYWASEPEMLQWLAIRNGLSHGEPSLLKEDKWLRYNVKSNNWTKSVNIQWGSDVKKFRGKELETTGQTSLWSNNALVEGWEEWKEFDEANKETWNEVELSTDAAIKESVESAKAAVVQPNSPVISITGSYWEKAQAAITALSLLVASGTEFEASPLRVEVPRNDHRYKLWFVVHKPEILRPHFSILENWAIRGYAYFTTKLAAEGWNKQNRFRIKPSGESQCSHHDHAYVIAANADSLREVSKVITTKNFLSVQLKTYNGVTFTPSEWQIFFYKHRHCSQCNGLYQQEDIRFINVVERTMQLVICPACNQKKFQELTPELQENMTALNGVDLGKWHPHAV